jgi:MIP family channel proteins
MNMTKPEYSPSSTGAHSRGPGEHDDAFEDASPGVFARRLLAEAAGTFALVVVDCGGGMIAAMSGGEVSPAARSAATGLLVMTMVYTMGDVSGAHLNPIVTFAFGLRRAFPWRHVPAYWVVQLLGAIAASAALRGLFGNVAHLGATLPGAAPQRVLAMEAILTAILVAVILGTATKHRVLGANAAIASGGAVALCSLFSRPISGASMNPARSIAPALVSGATGGLWLYIVGPAVGAVVGTALMHAIHQRKHPEEREAASGEPK